MTSLPGTNPVSVDPATRPVLIYDGDCAFCLVWVRYWQRLTGPQIHYRPYQEAAADYPGIAVEEFRRASQYIAPGGARAGGAEATFRVLAHVRGKRFWLTLYQHLPGFAALCEFVYSGIAAHRSAAYQVTRVLWGRDIQPPRYGLVASLFTRLLGLIYLCAFASFAVQAAGLIGSHGIVPLTTTLAAIRDRFGTDAFFQMPMVFWLNGSDFAIGAACWAGAAFAALIFFNWRPRLCLFACFLLYLSLVNAGGVFMYYQWDSFLLEAGFITWLLSFSNRAGIWLLRWLLFRFMFLSGMVKILSGDPSWRHLSALNYHFLTQPLPTPLAWYAAQLPSPLLAFATGATFFIELVLPFLIFMPRRLRFLSACGILLLEGVILLTGNYNWFNLQTMLLCLPLFDDAALLKILPRRLGQWATPGGTRGPLRLRAKLIIAAVAGLSLCCSLVQMEMRLGREPPELAWDINAVFEPLHLVSSYGLFAVMTTERNEIILQGSRDGVHWRDYEFRFKPGDVRRAPPWNIPHQPRLDWQMWFASLDDPDNLPWLWSFIQKLLQNDQAVIALLRSNPFPDQPPRFIRAQFYQYTWASRAEKAKGIWWDRRLVGSYMPAVSLP